MTLAHHLDELRAIETRLVQAARVLESAEDAAARIEARIAYAALIGEHRYHLEQARALAVPVTREATEGACHGL